MSRIKAIVARSIAEGARGRILPGAKRRSRYGNYPEMVADTGIPDVINQGSFSPFNRDRKMHRNGIKVRIKVPDTASIAARIVITAGDHEGKTLNGITLADHILTDGVNTYKGSNGATDVTNVDVKAQFGISNVQSVKNFQELIRKKGMIVSATRYKFQLEDQILNKIHFNQFDYMGDHGIDFIDPEIEHDPNQYHDKDLLIPLKYVLNSDTIMMLDVEPGETVQLTMYMSQYQDLNRLLLNEARRTGSNILL